MTIDQKFIDQFVNVTSKAAISSYQLVGKKDKVAADKAAADSMRKELIRPTVPGKTATLGSIRICTHYLCTI